MTKVVFVFLAYHMGDRKTEMVVRAVDDGDGGGDGDGY